MKQIRWQILLGLALVSLSAILYFIHYLIFHNAYHIFIYLLGDIAFVPIEVLFVTLIIHELLNLRDKRAKLKKMNMVIGAFYSEVGTQLLKYFSQFNSEQKQISDKLKINNEWTDEKFLNVRKELKKVEPNIDIKRGDLKKLREFLIGKRNFLLRLLENPNLLEHDAFTDLLWAVFHLTEELENRADVSKLPDSDYAHLSIDINRAFMLLIVEWLCYMDHLRVDYPYLFSLAMRMNPFDLEVSVVVK
jgi:hypothetical protein